MLTTISSTNREYSELKSVYAKVGSPAMIARPINATEIAEAIRIAKEKQLVVAVRSGGHSGAGHSTTNEMGMVIDLSKMTKIEIVDKINNLVKVEAGVNWGELSLYLKSRSLTISSGDTASVGVTGLTLGGGIGWMVRSEGLALDNVQAAEVITADGILLNASDQENPDLFWALRGGGGNFGIVSSLTFRAKSQSQVLFGTITYAIGDAQAVLKGYRAHMRLAARELTASLTILPEFPAQPATVNITLCYCGEKEKVQEIVNPLKQLAKPVKEDITWKDYADILTTVYVPASNVVVNNMFVKYWSDELMDQINKLVVENQTILQIRSLGGRMNEVSFDATAFPHRDSEILLLVPTFGSSVSSWDQLKRFGRGCYVNLLSDDSQDTVKLCYPSPTYEKLAKIKAKYDPDNFFRLNYNIIPAML